VSGFWAGVAAFAIWGLVPIYWKLLTHVPAIEALAHRIVWSLAVLVILVAAARLRGQPALSTVSRRLVRLYALAAVLIAANWFLYIFAVNAGFIVETSLGYYITPLVNVLFGVVVFHERCCCLRPRFVPCRCR
jgi:chloramphenicol-sensitive protein RarD